MIRIRHTSGTMNRNSMINTKSESQESGESNFEGTGSWGFAYLEIWNDRVGTLKWDRSKTMIRFHRTSSSLNQISTINTKSESQESGESNFEGTRSWGFIYLEIWDDRVGILTWERDSVTKRLNSGWHIVRFHWFLKAFKIDSACWETVIPVFSEFMRP